MTDSEHVDGLNAVLEHTDESASTLTNSSRTLPDGLWVRIVVAFLFALLVVHLLLGSHAGFRHRHTCVVCRLERMDDNWKYQASSSTYTETSCSTWYATHVEPKHDHVWSPNSAYVMLNFYHQTLGVGDNENRAGRAIWRLTPEQQLLVYQNSKDPLETKDVFLTLVDPAMMKDRHDLSIVDSIRDWIDSGFSKPWHLPASPTEVTEKQ